MKQELISIISFRKSFLKSVFIYVRIKFRKLLMTQNTRHRPSSDYLKTTDLQNKILFQFLVALVKLFQKEL